MTRYTVTWWESASGELANLWIASSDKQAITDAADMIDRALKVDATTLGRRVSSMSRELIVTPLRVLFRVIEADRKVEVYKVELFISEGSEN